MAEIPYGGPVPAPETAQRTNAVQTLGTITNWAGAAVSLALLVGVGIWSYRMIVRDVSGVPVVRAASQEPMRVAPEDPGGRPALHQGLAVNEVAARGAATKPADRLILAPAPVSLETEDQPQENIQMAAPVPEEDGGGGPTTAEPPQMGSIRALADRLAAGAAPLADPGPASAGAPEIVQQVAAPAPAAVPARPQAPEVKVETAVAKPEIKGGLKHSLRPVLRPGKLKPAAVAVAPRTAGALDVDPADIPPGTKLAQLGAFDSRETAQGEWDKLNARFEDYLEGKQRVIQRAQSGGRVFYRLRAMGFADLSDARRFCSALVAEKADCIPVSSK